MNHQQNCSYRYSQHVSKGLSRSCQPINHTVTGMSAPSTVVSVDVSFRWAVSNPVLPSRVSDFANDWKPICDFLLLNNTDLYAILHCFWVIMAYWSNYCFWQTMHLFNSLIQGQPWSSGLWNLALKTINILWCTKYFATLNLWGVDHQCDRRMDRQNCNSNSMCLTMWANEQCCEVKDTVIYIH